MTYLMYLRFFILLSTCSKTSTVTKVIGRTLCPSDHWCSKAGSLFFCTQHFAFKIQINTGSNFNLNQLLSILIFFLLKYRLRICAVQYISTLDSVVHCTAFLDHCCGGGPTSISRRSPNFLGWSDPDPNILTFKTVKLTCTSFWRSYKSFACSSLTVFHFLTSPSFLVGSKAGSGAESWTGYRSGSGPGMIWKVGFGSESGKSHSGSGTLVLV